MNDLPSSPDCYFDINDGLRWLSTHLKLSLMLGLQVKGLCNCRLAKSSFDFTHTIREWAEKSCLLFNNLFFDILNFFCSLQAIDSFFIAFDMDLLLLLLLLLLRRILLLFWFICKQINFSFIFNKVFAFLIDLWLKRTLLKLL